MKRRKTFSKDSPIKRLCDKHKVDIETLAMKIGCKESTAKRIYDGKPPNANQINALLQMFPGEISMSEIYGKTPPMVCSKQEADAYMVRNGVKLPDVDPRGY